MQPGEMFGLVFVSSGSKRRRGKPVRERAASEVLGGEIFWAPYVPTLDPVIEMFVCVRRPVVSRRENRASYSGAIPRDGGRECVFLRVARLRKGLNQSFRPGRLQIARNRTRAHLHLLRSPLQANSSCRALIAWFS